MSFTFQFVFFLLMQYIPGYLAIHALGPTNGLFLTTIKWIMIGISPAWYTLSTILCMGFVNTKNLEGKAMMMKATPIYYLWCVAWLAITALIIGISGWHTLWHILGVNLLTALFGIPLLFIMSKAGSGRQETAS